MAFLRSESLKSDFLIGLTVGAIISVALIALEPVTNYALLSFEMPGISAALVFWALVGNSPLLGTAVAWLVNTLVYGVGMFVVIAALRTLLPAGGGPRPTAP